MAKPPITIDPAEDRRRKKEQQRAVEDDALLKEIDDAVRQDDLTTFGKRYGWLVGGVLVLGLVGFGGFLWWNDQQRAADEARSEALVAALDRVDAGALSEASAQLQNLIDEGDPGASAIARLLQGGIALENGNPRQAGEIFAAIAADGDTPDEIRSLALVRQISVQFDQMQPAEIVAALKAEATPGAPYFGSAAEMTAMALLEQGRNQEAGALFAEIAKAEDVPETIKSRVRQMAGLLGVDTVENVDGIVEGDLAETAVQPLSGS